MKKKIIILGILLLVATATTFGVIYKSTEWKRIFEIEYIGFIIEGCDVGTDEYGLYKITNTTNKTCRIESAVFRVENEHPLKDFYFEKSIYFSIKPGATVEYRLHWSDVGEEAIKKGDELKPISPDTVIVKLKWKYTS
ncbi:MAG TPA: hypothetical protein PK629_04415 [Oscillospiraceae bacterium]|nr:hypothetical protein [Oscillospiraceae bacterium]HPF55675.1 hypothetical protein [Clostridiales bacterium]HPK35139.1 hypothetical protein [Oscillospiraceae bacterium]HPR74942.1 hypothetical protein [Oscillospiraceae bacterium]